MLFRSRDVARCSVFTIHTPVAAGNERFEADLVRRVAGPLFDGDGREGTGGVPVERLLELGRGVDHDLGQFDMTAFCLRLSNGANAVSQLHGETANGTWREIAPRPILAVTNGVHPGTWMGRAVRELLEGRLGANLDNLDSAAAETTAGRWWERLDEVPDRELWEAHRQIGRAHV